MPLKLCLLRHAIALERGAPGFEDDRLRPLTDEGRAKMNEIAAGMLGLGLAFDVILTSPYVRARETAEIVGAMLRQKSRLKLEPALQPDHSPQEFIGRLMDRHAGRKSVLAVGHEPFLSSLATLLLGLPGGSALVMKKGGLCQLTIQHFQPRPVAELNWLLTPKQLRALA